VANLFRILHTSFYQNRPNFVEYITKTFWLTFFLDTVYTSQMSIQFCVVIIILVGSISRIKLLIFDLASTMRAIIDGSAQLLFSGLSGDSLI